jgi:hypothetical protein
MTNFLETEKAIAEVDANASELWKAKAREALVLVATVQKTLTATDVDEKLKQLGEPAIHDRRAMGPIMRWGWAEGFLRPTFAPRYEVDERRAHCHNQLRRVWESAIFTEKP